jgi:capsular polysaccharide biosynthesis protein
MTTVSKTPSPPPPDYDWDAEREVDFRRYWDALLARWWLPVLALVVGAIIGYAVSLGGGQVYNAQATLYLGQPYTASGNVQLQSAQTNPSTVRTIVHASSIVGPIAKQCKMKTGALKRGVSVAAVGGNIAKNGQTPEVALTVQANGPRKASCAVNGLARAVVANPSVAGFANRKIQLLRSQIVTDERTINTINKVIASGSVSPTDQLVVQLQLRNAQADLNSAAQLLAQARQVEAPKVIAFGTAQKVTARSRRNSVVVAAIVGLIVGIVAALAWESVAARVSRGPAA